MRSTPGRPHLLYCRLNAPPSAPKSARPPPGDFSPPSFHDLPGAIASLSLSLPAALQTSARTCCVRFCPCLSRPGTIRPFGLPIGYVGPKLSPADFPSTVAFSPFPFTTRLSPFPSRKREPARRRCHPPIACAIARQLIGQAQRRRLTPLASSA
ncbi:hypothetical protein NL676_010815 [Syzygium grande]|nr:hypothetical protein NL676_010815 [Syzygium grande]